MKPFCYHSFDLRQLVSFAEIARTGSFRQAAKTLHIAQPALSRQIKQLETALGIDLFERAPRRLHLTIEGRELAERLPAFFSQIEFLTETVKGVGGGWAAQIRLRKDWPNLRLSVVQNTSEGFFHDLLENRIDCAFPGLEPTSIDLASHKLCRLEIGVVLPPGHRLAEQSEIRFDRLRNERWIFPPRDANPVLYDELIRCCHKAGFTPNIIAEMTQRPRVISQVACGVGIATLVRTLTHLCIGGTTYHPLIRPTPTVDCYLVYRKNPSSPLLKSFISICLELGKNFQTVDGGPTTAALKAPRRS